MTTCKPINAKISVIFVGFHLGSSFSSMHFEGNVLRDCNDTLNNPPRRTPGHDKLCHVRPVLDAVSKTCLDNYKPPKEQTIDEGMIAFKGRLSFKQYLPAKPTKFGIKVWERASPYNGYPKV
jgi:hypothetical protein